MGTSPITEAPARSPRTAGILLVLLAAQFMAMLDASIVNVAAPTIRRDLHTTGAELQLIVAGYIVAYAMGLITGARLGDRWGHGRVFRVGLAGFTVASLACGLAPDSLSLIVFRVLQGVAAAAMMPQVMSLIQRTFTGPARARALSLYGVVIAGGAVAGQVLGGLLVAADLAGTGWRPVFAVNVPVGVVLWWLARRLLPADRGDPQRRMDLPGVLTISVAVALVVLPLVLGHEAGWPWWTWVSLAGAAPAFAVFARVERAVAKHGGAPLVTGRLLRAPGLVPATLVLLLALLGYAGYLFTLALHLQSALGYGPAVAGLIFAPMAVGFAISGITWQLLPGSWHRRIIPIGLVVVAVAQWWLAALLSGGADVGVDVLLVQLLLGLASGWAFSPVITVGLAGVPRADAADASGLSVTVFQLGQVLGVATLGTLYLSAVSAPGAAASADALVLTFGVLGGVSVLAAVIAGRLTRQ